MQRWDIVIAGGGLAGLALACELANEKFSSLRICIIEPRAQYVRDRTWSYWNYPGVLPARWAGLAQHVWTQWRVSHQAADIVRGTAEQNTLSKSTSEKIGYASLPADAFYQQALQIIAQAKHIELRTAQKLQQATSSADAWLLQLDTGEQLQATWLMDSRPPISHHSQDWVQHFEGWEIETSQPCFEPSCMDLMAFETHSQGLKFLYCLPTSPTRALVESTWISRAGLKVDYAAHLQQALHVRWAAGAYDIVFREQGALALWPGEQSEQPQYLQLGRAGGTLRPSTGYAFTASLWHAEQIAHSLKLQLQAGGSLQAWKAPRWSRSRVDDWMDRVLFRVLEQDWPSAPDYFVQMFERIPPMPLIRFLSGQASMVDRMVVMQALPMRPFVGAAFSTLRGAKL